MATHFPRNKHDAVLQRVQRENSQSPTGSSSTGDHRSTHRQVTHFPFFRKMSSAQVDGRTDGRNSVIVYFVFEVHANKFLHLHYNCAALYVHPLAKCVWEVRAVSSAPTKVHHLSEGNGHDTVRWSTSLDMHRVPSYILRCFEEPHCG